MGFFAENGSTKQLQKILLVDDDVELRAGVRWQLEVCGFEVLEASHGNEALEILSQEENPSLIVTDLDMPEMDGVEFVSFLKKDAKAKVLWGQIPVIVLSGSVDRHSEVANHIVAFYQKPDDLKAMIDAIKLIYLAK